MRKVNINDPGNADLSRIYAATARDEPPAALDGAVLALAQRAAENRMRSGSRHWTRFAAIAATLVVTASLVVLMEREQPQIGVLAPPARDAALEPAAKVPTEAVQAAEMRPAEVSRREEKPASSGRLDLPARDQQSEQSSREPEQSAGPKPLLADSFKAAIPAPDRQAFPAPRTPAIEDARVSAAAASSSLARAESGLQPSGVAAAAAASNASGAAQAEQRSPQAAAGAARKLVNPDSAKKDESPDAWLARIAELRKQGRIKEAEESFAAFRKRYPDYPIPAAKAESP